MNQLTQKQNLKIGNISFINCLPFTLGLNFPELEYINGNPQELNCALREGLIDIAPISSFEFLQNHSQYISIESLGISSKTKAMSVLIFIRNYQSFIEDPVLHLSSQSATSANLSKIILFHKYKIQAKFETLYQNSNEINNKLLIGDEALLENPSNYELIIDLGEAWFELTKLPMVFAIWAINEKSQKLNLVETIKIELQKNLKRNLGENFPNLIVQAYKQSGIPKNTLTQYFNSLSYTLDEQHQESLKLFQTYLGELKLL